MYSGTTLRSHSGKIVGAHQKIDRVSRAGFRHIATKLPFPKAKDIVHFEGHNGPDALKRKSPAQDEPWHYYNPLDPEDRQVIGMVLDHRANLIKALKNDDMIRAAFEAAWMSHALVDGLTPAHHFPFEEELEQIRGEGKETRDSIGKKLIYPGKNLPEKLRNNWHVWGTGGVMTTHGVYEWGVATIMAPLKFKDAYPDRKDIARLNRVGIEVIFKQAAKQIYDLNMYKRYQKMGWTNKLAQQTRDILAPLLIKVVILAWYDAASEAAKK